MVWLIPLLAALALIVWISVRGQSSPSSDRSSEPPPTDNQVLLERLRAAEPPELARILKLLKLRSTASAEAASHKYRRIAGHSLANLGRWGEGASYHQILVDVADKLKPGIGWTRYSTKNSSVHQIEDAIWGFALERGRKTIAKLSPEQRQQAEQVLNDQLDAANLPSRISFAAVGSLATQLTATFTATPMALALFYQGAAAGLYAGVAGITFARLLAGGSVAALPVAILATLAWLATPGYKKTIPVTLALIAVRLRLDGERRLRQETP